MNAEPGRLRANDTLPDFWSREARKAAAIRDVQDRLYAEWLRISSALKAEIDRIKREGV